MTLPTPPSTGHGRRMAMLVLAVALLTGILAGIAVDRALLLPPRFGPRPPHGPPGPPPRDDGVRERAFRDRMSRELGLTDAQRTAVDSILDAQLADVRAIREANRPRLDSIRDRTRRGLDAVLTPAQREKAKRLTPRGPGPGGPPMDGPPPFRDGGPPPGDRGFPGDGPPPP